ncbi:MAG: hypothetical protein ACE5J3_01735 [Methanosarcinales archaeon]
MASISLKMLLRVSLDRFKGSTFLEAIAKPHPPKTIGNLKALRVLAIIT